MPFTNEFTPEMQELISKNPDLEQKLNKIINFHDDVNLESLQMKDFGMKMAFKWLPRFENNILAFVYLGAAFLVLVLGLRGLGSNIPDFLKGESGRLNYIYIYIALIFEFLMLLVLSAAMYFKIEDHDSLFNHFFIKRNEDNRSTGDAILDAEEAIKVIQRLIKDYDELKKLLNNLSVIEKKFHTGSKS